MHPLSPLLSTATEPFGAADKKSCWLQVALHRAHSQHATSAYLALSLTHSLFFSLSHSLTPFPRPAQPTIGYCVRCCRCYRCFCWCPTRCWAGIFGNWSALRNNRKQKQKLNDIFHFGMQKKKLQNGRQLYEIWYLPRTENYKSNWFPVPPVSHVWYGIVPLVVVPYIGRNRIKGPSLGLTDFSFNLHIVCALFRVHALTPRGWSALQLQRGGERVRKRERERSVECALWY